MAVRLNAEASQFKKEMQAAAQSVKSLAAESKLADAELRKTGDTQAYVEQKTAALTRQIDAQRTAVEAAEKGLAAVEKAYGKDSDQARAFTEQLVRQRTALANLEADLNGVTGKTAEVSQGMSEASQAAKDLHTTANASRFTAYKQALDSVSQKLDSFTGKIKSVATSIWNTAKDSASWADTLSTNASKWGLDTKTLQQWQYAANFVDVEVSTIAAANQKLLSAMRSNSSAFGELGVRYQTVSGGLRSTQDVFWDAITALNQMTDETERDAAAQNLFGKSFADLKPLIEAGRDAWEDYCDEAERAGLILTDEQVGNLNSFNDSLNRMTASISTLKNGLMAELAPGFEAISDTAHRVFLGPN